MSSPYPGLAPFREEESPTFFGRENEVSRSVERLLINGFLAVLGPSGIGKTSFIRAGIIPELKRKHSDQIEPVVFLRPGTDPIANFAAALEALPIGRSTSPPKPLLVFDQFEEFYTLADSVDRENVIRDIASLLDDRSIAVLISIRSDFFSRLFETPTLVSRLESSSIFLGPLPPDSLKRAIVEPASLCGFTFETGLVDRILLDLGSTAPSLPLLQIVLNNLTLDDGNRAITLSDYERHGTIGDALEDQVEQIWQWMSKPERKMFRSIMLRLVTVMDDQGPTRRVLPLDHFSEDEGHIINRLVSEHVLTVHQDSHHDQTVVEVIHEAIFSECRRFSQWLQEERVFLILRHRVLQAAQWWEEAGRDSSYLLTGGLLERAREILEHRPADLGRHELNFIQKSITASDRFSAWKLLTSGLGFDKLQSEVVEREGKRATLQEEIENQDKEIQQMQVRKAQLMSQLEENREQIERMTPKVFLSYAREDFDRVKRIYDKLKEHGLQPWLDRVNLLPGVEWDREIVTEIKQSHFVLFCLSPRSINKRGYVQKELRTALRVFDEIPAGQTYLIPVRLEECEVPDDLAKYHFADVFRDGEFDRLLKSILKQWAHSRSSQDQEED